MRKPNGWITSACEWCGSDEYVELFNGPDLLEEIPGSFTMGFCPQCGLYRQNPRLTGEELIRYYPKDYRSYAPLIAEETNWLRRIDRSYGQRKRRILVEKYSNGGILLEIGCGSGLFIEEMSKSPKWIIKGLEPNSTIALGVEQKFGIKVIQHSLTENDFLPSTFDAIVMWNVLEHLETPIHDIRIISSLLKPGGILAISIPNLESIERKLFGPSWSGWDLPRHQYLFPRDVLRKIINSHDLTIVTEQCISTSHHMFGLNLTFWLASKYPHYSVLRQLIDKIYSSLIMRFMLFLPFNFLDRLGLSDFLTVIARKNDHSVKE